MPLLKDMDGGEGTEAAAERASVPPRISDWVWHPWYAKAWWLATAVFWTGAFVAGWVSALRVFFQNDRFAVLFLILHPFVIFPVLGFGFARAWVRYRETCPGVYADGEVEDLVGKPWRYARPHSSMLDPLNLRSPLNLSNRLNPINRQHRR